ncbi:MAG TPA: RNA polymerase sigma factor [Verrucomicrobiae bacterium]|jgi:RNA polymerase sigma-70 factor (ECF subfamily)|nr:RNA polymerase sigma factor [Verrucomicrobiae bacterium]
MDSESKIGGDREGIFRQWLDRHIGLILKIVRGYAVTPQDQDDLFQDILLQLWSSIPAFRGDAKETTWIYRVAFNTSLAWQRTEKRRRQKHETFIQFDTSSREQASHVESLVEREVIEQLYAAIRNLPRVDASLALMHLDGVSYQEMSEILGISENYIGVKLSRIRNELADQMKGATR